MVFERNRVPPIPIIVNSVDRQNPLSFSKNFQGISDTLLERETLIPSSRFRIPARGLSGTGERVRERESGAKRGGWRRKGGARVSVTVITGPPRCSCSSPRGHLSQRLELVRV